MALSSNGVVYTWGYNANGQLGTTDTVRPRPPAALARRTRPA